MNSKLAIYFDTFCVKNMAVFGFTSYFDLAKWYLNPSIHTNGINQYTPIFIARKCDRIVWEKKLDSIFHISDDVILEDFLKQFNTTGKRVNYIIHNNFDDYKDYILNGYNLLGERIGGINYMKEKSYEFINQKEVVFFCICLGHFRPTRFPLV